MFVLLNFKVHLPTLHEYSTIKRRDRYLNWYHTIQYLPKPCQHLRDLKALYDWPEWGFLSSQSSKAWTLDPNVIGSNDTAPKQHSRSPSVFLPSGTKSLPRKW
ncbi:hypothetical protein TNCV_3682291 [Trichonephila clavipes]|uniref:Uncharacterized protein n=1 Tax=Trichonephila clavipes TaxID=2585209 RepID=A0A8X6RAX3_TRICX|nr:hypothetical protein TNCV_3682291 [Trichonephila clavipes]